MHVISKSALNAIFDCFDTARDLIDYLERKQEAFLGDTGFLIEGEENLVAAYMLSQKEIANFGFLMNLFQLRAMYMLSGRVFGRHT